MTKTKSIQIRISGTQMKGGWRAVGDMIVSLLLFAGFTGTLFSMFAFDRLLPILVLAGALVVLVGHAVAEERYIRVVMSAMLVLWLVVFAVLASGQLLAGAALTANQFSDGLGEAFSQIFPHFSVQIESDAGVIQLYFLVPVALLLAAGSISIVRGCNVVLPLLLFLLLKLLQAIAGLTGAAGWELLFCSGVSLLVYRCYFAAPTTRGRRGGKAVCAMALITALFTIPLLAVLPQSLREKPQIAEEIERTVRKALHELQYGKKQADNLPEGDFTDLGAFYRNDTTVLKVTMSHPDSLYLRGYVGSVYNGNGWEGPEKESLYVYANRFYWLHANGFYGQLQLAMAALAADDTWTEEDLNEISIENVGTDRSFLYTPYELCNAQEELLGTNAIGDIRPRVSGPSGSRSYAYTALPNQVKRCTSLAAGLYEQADTNAEVETYLIHESQYNTYVYNQYLQLPDSVRELLQVRLGSYDTDAAAHAAYPYAKQKILDYLTEQVRYSEDPAGNRKRTDDFLQYFLENSGEGYSVHYATAATLMFRYYGIPARYVEGYLITPEDVKDAAAHTTICVSGMRAHAWTEIYRDGIGWIPFEVTPPYLGVMEQAEELAAYQTAQSPKEEAQPETEKQGGDQYEENVDDTLPDYTDMITEVTALLLAALLIAVLLCVLIRFIICRWRQRRREALFISGTVPDAVQAMFRYALELLGVLGVKRGSGSLYECQTQVETFCGAELAGLYRQAVDTFQEASYSRHPMTEVQRQQLQHFYQAVLECLKEKAGRIRKIRYRIWDGLY